MAPTDSLWEVVGGAAKGGLVVREGPEQGSAELPGRLSTGALVLLLEHDVEAERLHYELVEGSGPEHGWVSTAFRGKALLVPAEDDVSTEEAGSVEDTMTDEMSSTEDAAGLAMQLYCARFGEAEGEELAAPSAPQDGAEEPAEVEAKACAELVQDLSTEEPTSEAAEDSDETEDSGLTLCRHCRLPVGQVAYHAEEGEEGVLHGECVAQCMLRELRNEEEKRKQDATEEKAERRAEYEIGWKAAEHVPSNAGPAAKLSGGAPQGMCCLVFDAETRSAGLASTVEPAAAVNLEYLSTALEVRRRENREPLFSLDPVDAESEFFDPKASMLVKRFEPAWLAGTSVGEVLFQSDYHLKELSMGEYEQPVLGMRSCLDFCEAEGHDQQWRAREWFVVNKAQIHLTEDNILFPDLQMGVEAREQIAAEHGFEDAKITRPDHPLVKYAEEFTRNFDLIAERKSVIYHLRELAKASILAKVLVDGEIGCTEPWFTTDLELKAEAPLAAVPQLWNDRCYSKIHVKGGKLQDVRKGVAAEMRGVYGGVHFGLDRLRLASVAVDRQPLGLQHRVPRSTFFPTEKAVRIPQGVDLSLNQFELSSPERTTEAIGFSQQDIPIGSAFWSSLANGSTSDLTGEDKALYGKVFNPHLSDRREEGDRFTPPGSSCSYAARLWELLRAEEEVRRRRREHFCSARFAAEDAGPLFPSSWTESVEVEGQAPAGARSSFLQPRPDYKDASLLLGRMLRSAAPLFDKTAEDGCRFRIYRFGSIEARTMQGHEGEEEVVAVFSARPPTELAAAGVWTRVVDESEKVVRATEYVERAVRRQTAEEQGSCQRPLYRRYYVVFETEQGNKIVTEQLSDGIVTFEENPEDLEDRSSLAKVFRSVGCSRVGAGTTLRDLKLRQMKEFQQRSATKVTARKRYSEIAYGWAVKEEPAAAPRREQKAPAERRAPASLRFAMAGGVGFGAGDRQLTGAGRRAMGERNLF
mmetsp:Transcript_105598/g.256443  ORF Transcript_105598/g.256443 Transcript_105598/m.256443 type:complete len:979 (-) Transcript_105598:108-3044(-)